MKEPRWLNDSEQLAWRALDVIVNRGLPQLEKTFRQSDMLMIEYRILAALSEAPGDEMRLSDLADLSNTSQSRLTHRMRRLLDRGDVEKRSSPDDGRVTYARLTPVGRERVEAIAPQHANDIQELIFDHLTSAQTEGLADALAAIAAVLCDHEHFQPDPAADA